MDKLADQFLKYVPAEIGFLAILLGIWFFGIYHYRGFRAYGDALTDRYFLSGAILIVAASALYLVNIKWRHPELPSGPAIIILVPLFEDDERGQFASMLATQLEALVHQATIPNSATRFTRIVHLDERLPDVDAARRAAERHHAVAGIFRPRVLRIDNKSALSFGLLTIKPEATKIVPFAEPQLPGNLSADLAAMLEAVLRVALNLGPDPALERVAQLERKLSDLETTLFSMRGNALTDALRNLPESSSTRHALVVGLNEDAERQVSPLQFAESDATAIASLLQELGFHVTLLLGEAVTRTAIIRSISEIGQRTKENDTVFFYFSGMSFQLPGDDELTLLTRDFSLRGRSGNLRIRDLANRISALPSNHKLILIDGCEGAVGLRAVAPLSLTGGNPSGPTVQVMTSAQNGQLAAESSVLQGGVFTHHLIGVVREQVIDRRQTLAISSVFAEITSRMARDRNTRIGGSIQLPQLITIQGSGEVRLAPRTRPAT